LDEEYSVGTREIRDEDPVAVLFFAIEDREEENEKVGGDADKANEDVRRHREGRLLWNGRI